MSKPWDTIDDLSMRQIINKMIKEHKKYTKAKKATMVWLLISFLPLLILLYLFYVELQFNIVNLMNIFSVIMGSRPIFLLLIAYLILAARVHVCRGTEKEFKKDYKEIRAQVTDNFNNIWRYNYEMAKCNEIVDVLNKYYKIDISYKG